MKHGSRTPDLDANRTSRSAHEGGQTGKGGRNLPRPAAGAEARTVAGGRTKPEALRLMEAAVERNNMLCAYERVGTNQGAPGVDGLTVAEFKPWLQAHWPKIRQALLAGEYSFSIQSTAFPFRPSRIAMCVIAVVAAARCQCFSPGTPGSKLWESINQLNGPRTFQFALRYYF